MAVVIGLLTFVSLVFYTPHADNSQVVTRMGLTLAIVEQGIAQTIEQDRE